MKVELCLAPNPGPYTGPGTNTWIVSSSEAAVVIDPGPTIPAHLDAIESSLRGLEPVAVLVTHTHPDHAPAANPLASSLGVPAAGFGPGPEFEPDLVLEHGSIVGFGAEAVSVVATPGHTPDHLCYRVGDVLFTGDHVMGGSTVIVDDMGDYLKSLRLIRGVGLERIYPGHGPVIDDPDSVVAEYIAHRLDREAQILRAIDSGAGSVGAIVQSVYSDVAPVLHPAAAISVGAHLRKLAADGVVEDDPAGFTWESGVARS